MAPALPQSADIPWGEPAWGSDPGVAPALPPSADNPRRRLDGHLPFAWREASSWKTRRSGMPRAVSSTMV